MGEIIQKTSTTVGISALTDTGVVRDHNEDNFVVCPDLSKSDWYLIDKPITISDNGALLVVADGMGGANAGEVASAIAVESIKNYFSSMQIPDSVSDSKAKIFFEDAIFKTHDEIIKHAEINPSCEGMGTTIVLAWVFTGRIMFCWCGDSRGYIFSNNKEIKEITNDHSLVRELVEAGKLTPEEADFHPQNNIITQSLGDPDSLPKPDFIIHPLEAGDKVILCSDGLNNMLTVSEIKDIIFQEKSLKDKNKELINAANNKGGKDNITCILLEVFATNGLKYKNTNRKGQWFFLVVFLVMVISIGLAFALFKNLPTSPKTQVPARKAGISAIQKENVGSYKNERSIEGETNKDKGQISIPFDTLNHIEKTRDSIDNEIVKRTLAIDSIFLHWDKVSLKVDSLSKQQSKHHINTVNSKNLFTINTLQEDFNKYLMEQDFKEVLQNMTKQNENPEIEMDDVNYDFQKIDRGIEEAKNRLHTINLGLKNIIET